MKIKKKKKWKNSMNPPTVAEVCFRDAKVFFKMTDGREAGCPTEWFPWLHNATEAERQDYVIQDFFGGVSWPSLDDGLSAEGMFRFVPNKLKTKKQRYR